MSIAHDTQNNALTGKVLSIEPAVDASGNRKLAQGREYSILTVLYDGEEEPEALPLWTPFEVAEHLVPVGEEVTIVETVKVKTSRSIAGVRASA